MVLAKFPEYNLTQVNMKMFLKMLWKHYVRNTAIDQNCPGNLIKDIQCSMMKMYCTIVQLRGKVKAWQFKLKTFT